MIVNDSLMSISIIFGFLAGVIVIVSFMADPCFREYIRVKNKYLIKTNQIVENEETKLSLITKTDTDDKNMFNQCMKISILYNKLSINFKY